MSTATTAPIAVFAFNRPHHLGCTLAALAANDLANESDLIIFCDGPRNPNEASLTDQVRSIACSASGFRSCRLVGREKNCGLATSIIAGVTEMLAMHDRLIVLEDDLITSPYFLRYMNDALECYAEDPRVASVHGWCFPHDVKNPPETFFLKGTDCWGWATWGRAWKHFEPDAGKLLAQIRERRLEDVFNLGGAYDYTGMLEKSMSGQVGSWAIRWHASAFLANMYTLTPGRSLVQNIGLDASGTHCGKTEEFSVLLASTPVQVTTQDVAEKLWMREAQAQAYSGGKKSVWRRSVKVLLKRWFPPVVTEFLRKMQRRANRPDELRWEGDYPDWQSAAAASDGYDRQTIFEKVRDAARAVRDGRALWERDSVLFYQEEYNWPLVASLMTVAAWNGGRLTVLDFGGALGSTFRQNRALLGGLPFLSWNIVEQAHIVACGREEFAGDVLTFWPDMDSCVEASPPDVILFSGVLQYLENPYALLRQAVTYGPQAIVIERTPFAEKGERITVQHVPTKIYEACYPCRWLDRGRVDAIMRKGYRLLPDYTSHVDPAGFYGIIALRQGT